MCSRRVHTKACTKHARVTATDVQHVRRSANTRPEIPTAGGVGIGDVVAANVVSVLVWCLLLLLLLCLPLTMLRLKVVPSLVNTPCIHVSNSARMYWAACSWRACGATCLVARSTDFLAGWVGAAADELTPGYQFMCFPPQWSTLIECGLMQFVR